MNGPLAVLQKVLERSVARQGEKPLTNAYLLNIVKMARRLEATQAEDFNNMMDSIYNDVMSDSFGD